MACQFRKMYQLFQCNSTELLSRNPVLRLTQNKGYKFHSIFLQNQPNTLTRKVGTVVAYYVRPNSECSRRYATTTGAENSMLAWQIKRYGGIGELELVEKEIPTITNPHEVLLKVHATSINPLDLKMMKGYGAAIMNRARKTAKPGGEFPLTLGRDCSGVIINVGESVTDFRVGEAVWAAVEGHRPGLHSQYVVVNRSEIAYKPRNWTHAQAASIPYVGITTWSALCGVANLKPKSAQNKRALVFGGSGGVGTFAIQLLKAWGANVSTTCSPDAFDLVKKLGATVAVDYRSSMLIDQLSRGGNYDIILNTVGESMDNIAYRLATIQSKAQYVTLVTPFLADLDKGLVSGLSSTLKLIKMYFKYMKRGMSYRWAFARPNAQALKTFAELIEKGSIQPVIDGDVYQFEDLPSAFKKIEAGHSRGKTVIEVSKKKDLPPSFDDLWKDVHVS